MHSCGCSYMPPCYHNCYTYICIEPCTCINVCKFVHWRQLTALRCKSVGPKYVNSLRELSSNSDVETFPCISWSSCMVRYWNVSFVLTFSSILPDEIQLPRRYLHVCGILPFIRWSLSSMFTSISRLLAWFTLSRVLAEQPSEDRT